MTYLKSLIKALLVFIISFFILTLLTTLFYHFNIVSNNIYKILKLIVPVISLFISTFVLGKNSKKKGWLEGMKLGGITILLFLTLASFLYNEDFTLKLTIYYIILLLVSASGGMIGINHKKD